MSNAKVPYLATRRVRPIKDWEEWKRLWKTTDLFENYLSLIHMGFDVPCWDNSECLERFVFYLNLAEGWQDKREFISPSDEAKTHLFKTKDHGHQQVTTAELRHLLAEKAFLVLCKKCFDPWGDRFDILADERRRKGWENVIFSAIVFPEILHFFRVEFPMGEATMPNMPKRHKNTAEHKVVYEFLETISSFAWVWKPSRLNNLNKKQKIAEDKLNYDLASRIREARLWSIEVAYGLGDIDMIRPQLLRMGGVYQKKLEEIALRTWLQPERHRVKEYRKVRNLEEALYAGNEAAIFLKQVRETRATEARLRKEFWMTTTS